MKRLLAKGLLAICGLTFLLTGAAVAGHPHAGCRMPPPSRAPHHHHHHHHHHRPTYANYGANYGAYYGGGRTVVYRPAPAIVVPYGNPNFGPGASFGFFFSSP